MAKFMFIASYHSEGAKGLLSSGGTARREQIGNMIESAGGTMESFYFAFGEGDAYVICDLPDSATATAISLAVNATGAASARTIALITPETVDEASKKSIDYRPPGA